MKKTNISPQVNGAAVPVNADASAGLVNVATQVNNNVIPVSAAVTGGSSKILYDTTEHWNSTPQLIAKKGYIYIYSDYKTTQEGKTICGIKIGNGINFLIDLAFEDEQLSEELEAHIQDQQIHITAAERLFWNNKITTNDELVQGTNLIFSKN